MPELNAQIRRALPANRDVILLKDFTSTERALGSSNRRVTFENVPTMRGKLWTHIRRILVSFTADVDSASAANDPVASERVLAQIANMRMHMLGGAVELLPGGDCDLRVPTFLQKAIRDQRAFPALPSDALDASAADVYSSDTFRATFGFGAAQDRAGMRRDGALLRAFFTDLLGQDSLSFDILSASAAASVGAVSDVTFNSLGALKVYAEVSYDPHPILDALPRLSYFETSDQQRRIHPIDGAAREHRSEYVGFRQREEDTEALTFANFGDLTLRHGDFTRMAAKPIAEIVDAMAGFGTNLSRATLANRYLPVTGHLPLLWDGPVANRDQFGRSPLYYDTTSLGSSRTKVRILQSELTSWPDTPLARAAKALDVAPDRLKALRERVRTVEIDPEILPRRIVL